jgi:hypothetical protein
MTERLELLSQDTTEQHVAQLAAERAAILDAVEDVPQRPLTAQPLTYRPQTECSTSPTEETAKKLEALHLKKKVKTRPTLPFPSAIADPPPAAVAANINAPDPEPEQPQPPQPPQPGKTETYAVKPDSLRPFQHMYPATPQGHVFKPIDWRVFVAAMADTGFVATQAGGSAVMFEKAGQGRIVFHRPHPMGKIDAVMLGSMGRRLGRWFGWERGKFIKRVKVEEGEKGEEEKGVVRD